MKVADPGTGIFEFPIAGHLHSWSNTARADCESCTKFTVSLECDLNRVFLSWIAHQIKLEDAIGSRSWQSVVHAWVCPHFDGIEAMWRQMAESDCMLLRGTPMEMCRKLLAKQMMADSA